MYSWIIGGVWEGGKQRMTELKEKEEAVSQPLKVGREIWVLWTITGRHIMVQKGEVGRLGSSLSRGVPCSHWFMTSRLHCSDQA